MKKLIVAIFVALLAISTAGLGQSIFKSDAPMPLTFLPGNISDKELVFPVRQVFPKACYENRGLRLYLPDNFSLVPVEDFKRLARWYWDNTPLQTPEDSVMGLVGVASSLAPWSKVPIGLAVRGNQYPSPYIYVVFVTREAGQLVAYQAYYDDSSLVCERISKDCLVRLVVIP